MLADFTMSRTCTLIVVFVLQLASAAEAIASPVVPDDVLIEIPRQGSSVRVPIGCRVVDHARRLGSYLQAQQNTAAEPQAAEQHFSPEAVLRETATIDFLAA